jgi:hypothetical protein
MKKNRSRKSRGTVPLTAQPWALRPTLGTGGSHFSQKSLLCSLQIHPGAVEFTLKGQCHEIFCFWFFYESVSPKPLSIPLGPFRIFSKIRGDIRS